LRPNLKSKATDHNTLGKVKGNKNTKGNQRDRKNGEQATREKLSEE